MKKTKRILALLLATMMVLSLAACGSKDKTDDDTEQKVETNVEDKSEEIVFTEDNMDEIVKEHEITVIGTFVSSVEVTEEDDFNMIETDEDGTIHYMIYTWEYALEDGTKLEVLEDFSNPDRPNAYYAMAFQDPDGNIYGQYSNGGVIESTKETTIYVLEQDIYESYMEFLIAQMEASLEESENETDTDINTEVDEVLDTDSTTSSEVEFDETF